jgi:hypothetical protein
MEWYTLVMKDGRTIGTSDLSAFIGVDYLRDVNWQKTNISLDDKLMLKLSIGGKK